MNPSCGVPRRDLRSATGHGEYEFSSAAECGEHLVQLRGTETPGGLGWNGWLKRRRPRGAVHERRTNHTASGRRRAEGGAGWP